MIQMLLRSSPDVNAPSGPNGGPFEGGHPLSYLQVKIKDELCARINQLGQREAGSNDVAED